jgi:hypothetical protein
MTDFEISCKDFIFDGSYFERKLHQEIDEH